MAVKPNKKPERYKGGWVQPGEVKKSERGLPICRNCGTNECAPPRRTFCSETCVRDWKIKSDPVYAAKAVFQRDKGICKECGINTVRLFHELKLLQIDDKKLFEAKLAEHSITPKQFKTRTRLWDVDHIREVAEGGGRADLDGLVTKCIACHLRKTIAYNKSRARSKK